MAAASRDFSSISSSSSSSDTDGSDCESASDQQIFYKELMKILESGMADRNVFENIINEIDALRKTHNQNPNAVMDMVMQGLLMLAPLLWPHDFKIPENVDPKQLMLAPLYLEHLHEVLRWYQGLVSYFAKWKNAKENYIRGIEESMKLLHSQQILRVRQDVVDLLAVIEAKTGLTFGDIIEDMHAGKYGEPVDKSVPFGRVPLFERPVQSVLPAVRSPVDAAIEFSKLQFIDRAPSPNQVLQMPENDWTYAEDKFTCAGGDLTFWSSDNTLHIPPDAIPKGQKWTIRIQIHTLLDKFDEKLKTLKDYDKIIPETNKQFRSSVVEFQIIERGALVNKEFNKPVTIYIRHTALESDRKDLRVFCVEDDNKTLVKIDESTSGALPYFQVKGQFVVITTKHFCSYFTCVCSKEQPPTKISEISAYVYGKIDKSDNGYVAYIDFELQILPKGSAASLSEFGQKQVVIMREQNKQLLAWQQLKFSKDFPAHCKTTLHVVWKNEEGDDSWVHMDNDTEDCGKIFPCRQQYTQSNAYFTLKGKKSSLSAAIELTFSCQDTDAQFKKCLHFTVKHHANNPAVAGPMEGFESRRLNTNLDRQHLSNVAKSIPHKYMHKLGQKLGFFQAEIEYFHLEKRIIIIEADKLPTFIGRSPFLPMLESWCNDRARDDKMSIEDIVSRLVERRRASASF